MLNQIIFEHWEIKQSWGSVLWCKKTPFAAIFLVQYRVLASFQQKSNASASASGKWQYCCKFAFTRKKLVSQQLANKRSTKGFGTFLRSSKSCQPTTLAEGM